MSDDAPATIIATLAKNAREEVRVALRRFKDFDLVDVRVFADSSSGGTERAPTAKGVALRVTKLPELIAALTKAEVEARRRGLLDGGGAQ